MTNTTKRITIIRYSQYWDVKCPPVKRRVIAGQFVPTLRGALGIHRPKRLVIEIEGSSSDDTLLLEDDDKVMIRVLRPKRERGHRKWNPLSHGDDEDSSCETVEHQEEESQYEGWMEYRHYTLEEIDKENTPNEKTWEASMGRTSTREVREFHFESADEAKRFRETLATLRKQVKERSEAYLEAFRISQIKDHYSTALKTNNTQGDELQILVEIVSATDLPIADHKTSDPYTICYLGKEEIHRTLPIFKSLNPIWTVRTGSLFLMQTSAAELFATSGLTFLVKDYDSVTKNDPLGHVVVPAPKILEYADLHPSERLEFPLTLLRQHKKASTDLHPILYLRFRHASKDDLSFLSKLLNMRRRKGIGIYADTVFARPRIQFNNPLQRESRIEQGQRVYRVKPYPDPERPDDTKWLSAKALEEETLKPSYNWIEAGSGRLGKIYLEVLKSANLPNMDIGSKTDAFCSIIYEDCIVNTDVINDELSPRWPPWSQRAFCFRMAHGSSQILIGVFDHEIDKGASPIGRVSVDVTNLHPNTEYVLVYDLYKSILDNVRRQVGTLTIRLKMEYVSFKDVVLGSLQLPALNYINLAKKPDFRCAHFVCYGEENLQRMDMEAIKSYKTELEEYLSVSNQVGRAALTVLLWRGHMYLPGTAIKLPLHSLIAYTLASCLIENWNRLPAFLFFCIAWFFLATNEHRYRHPSPWCQPMSFAGMWRALLFGDMVGPVSIADHENEGALRRYNQALLKRQEDERASAERAQTRAEEIANLTNGEGMENSGEMMETKFGKASINPLAPLLLRVQDILGLVCKCLRITKSVIMWDECYFAFALANTCLALSLVFLFVPWNIILRWTFRFLVHIFMGPWMKLVDVFYVQKLDIHGEDNAAKQVQLALREKMESLNVAKQALMVKMEDFSKTKAIKRYMFGKFVTRVPQFKEYRYVDIPRPESTARPSDVKLVSNLIMERQHGQALTGQMIPKWSGAEEYESNKEYEYKVNEVNPSLEA